NWEIPQFGSSALKLSSAVEITREKVRAASEAALGFSTTRTSLAFLTALRLFLNLALQGWVRLFGLAAGIAFLRLRSESGGIDTTASRCHVDRYLHGRRYLARVNADVLGDLGFDVADVNTHQARLLSNSSRSQH